MTKEIKVDGMMCMHCVAHVKKALEGIEGVTAEVSLPDKAVLTCANEVPDDVIKKAIEDAGYSVK